MDQAQTHPSTEMLADLLSGSIEADDLQQRVVPHLLERCPTCRGRVEGIRRLQRRFDHWNESVVVRESAEALRLLAELLRRGSAERQTCLADDESFHTWGLARLLLAESRTRLFDRPEDAVELAELAVAVSEHLVPAYHPDWVADLQALAWAHLGNALRVSGELRGAEAAFRRALRLLDQGSTGRPEVRAEVLDLEASLRREQRRWAEAGELLDQVIALHRQSGDSHRVGRAMLGKAKVLEEGGAVGEAITLLAEVPPLLDARLEPRLRVYARHNLLCCLVGAGRFAEARELLAEVRDLLGEEPEVDRVRLRWAEGRIAHGLGEVEAAETALREARGWFVEHTLALDAARVSLDLAALYLEAGRMEDLEKIAAEVSPLFRSRDLHREALLALVLFQRAVEQRTVTLELVREMAELLRRRRRA